MDATEILFQRARMKIVELRALASRGTNCSSYEPWRLFKEIEKDAKCSWILNDSTRVKKQPEVVKFYNEHIRQSKLSEEEKEKLFI